MKLIYLSFLATVFTILLIAIAIPLWVARFFFHVLQVLGAFASECEEKVRDIQHAIYKKLIKPASDWFEKKENSK